MKPSVTRAEFRKALTRYGLFGQLKRRKDDERDAVLALAAHLYFREHQDEYPAFDNEDCTILTGKWMQVCLRAVGARKCGRKAGYAARSHLIESSMLIDTGRVKKPTRTMQANHRAEKFQKVGIRPVHGGRSAQPTRLHSYWWPVYLVPALARHLARLTLDGLTSPTRLASVLSAPARDQRSLLARGECQGQFSSRRKRARPNPGSVQWAFQNTGPP